MLEGLVPLLQRMQLDDNNPQIREWAVFAVRNLTEDCPENQAFIASIEQKPRAVANPDVFADADIEVQIDRLSGKVKMHRAEL